MQHLTVHAGGMPENKTPDTDGPDTYHSHIQRPASCHPSSTICTPPPPPRSVLQLYTVMGGHICCCHSSSSSILVLLPVAIVAIQTFSNVHQSVG